MESAWLERQTPYLTIKDTRPTRDLGGANVNLQLSKQAYTQHIAGAVIDNDTGEQLKY